MGQGIYTGEAMLIAEELEVGLDQIAGRARRRPTRSSTSSRSCKSQATGGSTSIRGAWKPLRQAGAAARTMLIAAAAAQWSVPAAGVHGRSAAWSRTGRRGRTPDLRRARRGGRAASPCRKDVPLKDPKDFKLIGKPARRVDTPSKVERQRRCSASTCACPA